MDDAQNKSKIFSRLGPEAVVCLLLVLATLAVYRQVKTFEFINFDDQLYVTGNHYVQQGLSWKNVKWAFSDATRFSNYWVPLTWLSILLDHELYGMQAGGYHLTNVIFHVLNTLLLFIVLRRMTGMIWRSAFVAALFALHPLHVESVAWVTERKDMLSTFFWMLSLLAYGWYVRRPGIKRYLPVFLCFVLGLMAKPMLVTLPFVLLLLDCWPLQRLVMPEGTGSGLKARFRLCKWQPLVLEKIPLFIMVVVVSVMAFQTQQDGGAVKSLADYPLNVRVGNALVTYILYIGKMFWPVRLSFFYPHPGALPVWQVIGAGLLLASITLAAFRTADRHPYFIVGWLWFIGTLFPVIGLVVIGNYVMADRYTYLSLVGLFVIVAWGVFDLLPQRFTPKWLVFTLSTVVLLVLSVTAHQQTAHWRDSIALCRHAIAVTGNNLGVYNNLAGALAVKGRYDEATATYRQALKIDPTCQAAYNNLGLILEKQGRRTEAARLYEKALKLDPDYALAHNNLGNVLSAMGNRKMALKHYRRAIAIDPDYAAPHYNIANVYLNQGRLIQAIGHYRQTLRIDPYHAEAHNNLGSALLLQGKTADALDHFREAVRIRPVQPEARRNLAEALARKNREISEMDNINTRLSRNAENPALQEKLADMLKARKKFEEAFIHYQKAWELDPDRLESLHNLGIICAMKGEYTRARAYFERSIERRPDAFRPYYLMAATYARQKMVTEAIKWLEKAVQKGFKNFIFLKDDPNFENIRSTSYLQALIRTQQ